MLRAFPSCLCLIALSGLVSAQELRTSTGRFKSFDEKTMELTIIKLKKGRFFDRKITLTETVKIITWSADGSNKTETTFKDAKVNPFKDLRAEGPETTRIALMLGEGDKLVSVIISPEKNYLTINRRVELRLGIQFELPNRTLIAQLDLPKDQGIVVNDVLPESAAARAGLKADDILLELDGKIVPSKLDDFASQIGAIKPETPVEAIVLRKGHKETVKGLSLPAGPPPEAKP